MTRGIRQGCPFSPLIFAVVVDVLLRRLARVLQPGGRLESYDLVHEDRVLLDGQYFGWLGLPPGAHLTLVRVTLPR